MTPSSAILANQEFEILVSEVYGAAAGRLPWHQPMDRMALLLGLWGVQVIGVNKRNGGLIFSEEGGPARSAAALDYLRFFHNSNPRIAPTLATPVGEWMHCHEHFDDSYVAQSNFYQEFLIPHGGRYLSATKLSEGDDFIFLFGVLRGHANGPIGPTDMPLLRQVGHHLTEAFRNFLTTRETHVELGMARQFLASFGYPMVIVDEARGIWHRNEGGAKMLADGAAVYDLGGVLACRDEGASNALTVAVRSLKLAEPDNIPPVNAGRTVVAIPRPKAPPLLALVSALRPADSMGVFGRSSRALVILHDPAVLRKALDPQIISECFDLTPAEARVAVQIAEGSTAKEIATRSGAALPTVRTHIQRAMEKIGVSRQADLIRTLIAIPRATLQTD